VKNRRIAEINKSWLVKRKSRGSAKYGNGKINNHKSPKQGDIKNIYLSALTID